MMLTSGFQWIGYFAAGLGGLVAVVAGAFRPRSMARSAFAAAMLVLSFETLFAMLASQCSLEANLASWLGLRFGMTALVPPTWMLFSFSYGRGDRKEVLRRRTWILVGAFALAVLLMARFRQSFVTSVTWGEEAGGIVLHLGFGSILLHLFVLAGSVIVLLAMEQTFRAAVGVMRWRMKFVALAVGLLFLSRVYTTSQALIYRQWWVALDIVHALALLVVCMLIAVAMMRAGLSSVEIYPSRKIITGSITLTLVGVYLVGVGLFAWVLDAIGGTNVFVLQALVALVGTVALTLILLSDRVRQRLNALITRHLRRPTHDYRTIWQRFADQTGSIMSEVDFCRAAVEIISETLRSNSVTIWAVAEDDVAIFGASTDLTRRQAEMLWSQSELSRDWVEGLRLLPKTVQLQKVSDPLLSGLKRFVALQQGGTLGDTLCVPLRSGNQTAGFMLVGKRVSNVPFTAEDFDLMDTVAVDVGRGLLVLRQTVKLVHTKEIEALRNMSAFMAHDLKNTAASLSLTLQNLRKHFGNPEFREDALRAVNQAVLHLNELNSGLSLLREGLEVRPVPGNLNELVERTVGELKHALGVEIQKDLQPLPPVQLDAPQMRAVLMNLLLNARDALQADGQIEIGTRRVDNWAQLSVADNGCGMPPEFLRQSLFRPFQTTKKKGLGIGLFQSKLIVESHQGSIHVESVPDQGTTFRILLPLAAQNS